MTRSDAGDNGTPAISSRRALGAGVIGAALAVISSRSVSASVPPDASSLSENDGLLFAMGIELSARDLYRAAIAAGNDPTILGTLAQQHAAYAQSIAGLTGVSANRRIDAVYDDAEAAFSSSDHAEVLRAAYDLEATLVATHTDLLGVLESVRSARLIASIIAVEARHGTVLADAAGSGDDLDLLLTNDASALAIEVQS